MVSTVISFGDSSTMSKWILCILLLLPSLTLGSISEGTSKNACELEQNFLYCHCNHQDPAQTEVVNCQVYGPSEPTMEEWSAVANLSNVKEFVVMIRPSRVLNYHVPGIVFSQLRSIYYFKMKMGNIEVMPAWAFSNSTCLNEINVEDNMISKLEPFSFANLSNLTKLNLAQNNIGEIQRDVFVKLINLTSLILSQNKIQVIHDRALKDLENLIELELHNNSLTVIVRDVFIGLKKLERLDLRYNRIELLGDHVFAELIQLDDLDLSGNRIVSVSPTAFSGLKEMRRLNLKDNKIVEFFSETFHHFPKVHFLDLRNNLLETFPKRLVTPLYPNFKNLTSMQFQMEGNRFKCDCRILWLQDLYKEASSSLIRSHLNVTECEFPSKKHSRLSREEATKKGMPLFLAEDSDEVQGDSQVLARKMTVMELAAGEFNCPPELPPTTKPQRKGGKKGKGRENKYESEINIVIENDAASLQNPEGRTESSSQSHQSNEINVPGSAIREESVVVKWIILLFLLFIH